MTNLSSHYSASFQIITDLQYCSYWFLKVSLKWVANLEVKNEGKRETFRQMFTCNYWSGKFDVSALCFINFIFLNWVFQHKCYQFHTVDYWLEKKVVATEKRDVWKKLCGSHTTDHYRYPWLQRNIKWVDSGVLIASGNKTTHSTNISVEWLQNIPKSWDRNIWQEREREGMFSSKIQLDYSSKRLGFCQVIVTHAELTLLPR